jgi:hypothetical protein
MVDKIARYPFGRYAPRLVARERFVCRTPLIMVPHILGWPMPCECVQASANSLIKVSMVASILAVICPWGYRCKKAR